MRLGQAAVWPSREQPLGRAEEGPSREHPLGPASDDGNEAELHEQQEPLAELVVLERGVARDAARIAAAAPQAGDLRVLESTLRGLERKLEQLNDGGELAFDEVGDADVVDGMRQRGGSVESQVVSVDGDGISSVGVESEEIGLAMEASLGMRLGVKLADAEGGVVVVTGVDAFEGDAFGAADVSLNGSGLRELMNSSRRRT